MADCYVLFSEVVPALSAEERAWAEHLLARDGVDDEAALAADLGVAGLDAADVDPDDWPGFGWSFEADGLCVFSQDGGSVAHVAAFVRAFLARFRPGDCWNLAWAETCSRPRPGQFGGGAAFVTAGGVEFCSARGWLDGRGRLVRAADQPNETAPA